MSRHHNPKAFWRLVRKWFRHVRIAVWLVILALLVIVLYLHNVGFPGFVQQSLIHQAERQGLTLQFSQLRLSYKGIAAEQVSLQPAAGDWAPQINCRQVHLSLSFAGMLRLKPVVESVTLNGGDLILPYEDRTHGRQHLTATNLQAFIEFTRNGDWEVRSIKGDLGGCRISASGAISNAGQMGAWRIFQAPETGRKTSAREILRIVSEVLKENERLSHPRLHLGFSVDGNAPEALELWLSFIVPKFESRWLALRDTQISASMNPMPDVGHSQIELAVRVGNASTDFGLGENLSFNSTAACVAESGVLLSAIAELTADRVDTVWAGAVDLNAEATWMGTNTGVTPRPTFMNFEASEFSTAVAHATGFKLGLEILPFDGDHRMILDLPEFLFRDIEPFQVNASVAASVIEASQVAVTNLQLDVTWGAPTFEITDLSVDLAGGHLDAACTLDAITGRVEFKSDSSFSPRNLFPVLPQAAVEWLDRFRYETPPKVVGVGGVTLPHWSPSELQWPGDVRPSLFLDGRLKVGAGSFRRVPLTGASTQFIYSNRVWRLPELRLHRPEGSIVVGHVNDERVPEFEWSVNGAVDPTPAWILLPQKAREVLSTLQFAGPPEFHLTIAGAKGRPEDTVIRGTVSATNFSFRGRAFDTLDTSVLFSNPVLEVREPLVRAGDGTVSASSIAFDFSQNRALLSNGFSSMPPMTIATVIGPKVVKVLQPYQFLEPPSGTIEGVIPLKGVGNADMHFNLKGGPFEWWRFHLPEVDTHIHWQGQTVAVEIKEASFYEGKAQGEAFFDFTDQPAPDFRFNFTVEDANAQPFVAQVFESTNRMEGILSGRFIVTSANAGDWDSWFGYGNLELEDGFIWSVPVFGIVSPVLDAIVPGLGQSRAKEAAGTLQLTNSIIRTDDLVINTSNMRLLYSGTLDFEGAVNAEVEAEIFGDARVVGELVSLALMPVSKAMVMEITGTLREPEARPLYLLPRILIAPLNPVKLFKDMFIEPPPEYEEFPSVNPSDEQPPTSPGQSGP